MNELVLRAHTRVCMPLKAGSRGTVPEVSQFKKIYITDLKEAFCETNKPTCLSLCLCRAGKLCFAQSTVTEVLHYK